MIKIGYALIIQNDGLDVIDTTAKLEQFGKVVAIDRGDEATGFVIESSLAEKLNLTFKLKKENIILIEDEDQKYVYYPVTV